MIQIDAPLDLPYGVQLPHRFVGAALREAPCAIDPPPLNRDATRFRRCAPSGYGRLGNGNAVDDRQHLGEGLGGDLDRVYLRSTRGVR